MVFSLSVGDAIALAKIAWRVGQAFTIGRQSAPAEFIEVQNLLYTLSQSLELLSVSLPPSEPSDWDKKQDLEKQVAMTAVKDADTVLQHMVVNCRSTLTDLERLVSRYTELEPQSANGSQSLRRWKADVVGNWKKVVWTTEGGDIIKLKGTLTAHISGLTLATTAVGLFVFSFAA